jgi:hypothetical protein
MKTLILLSALLLSSAGAFAAEKIECSLDDSTDGKVVATLVRAKPIRGVETFNITIDDSVNSGYFSVEDRGILRDKKANADKLSDWDGNSGVEISFRKGFLAAGEGVKSKAFLHSYYDDIATDDVKHVLSCTVIQ